MDIYSKLYWLTRLDGIQGLFIFFAIVSGVIIIGIIIANLIHADNDYFYNKEEIKERKSIRAKRAGKLKWVISITILLSIISVLIPTKNEVIFIVAGGKTINWIQSDTSINKIPSQTTAIISEFLDKQIKELKSGEKEK